MNAPYSEALLAEFTAINAAHSGSSAATTFPIIHFDSRAKDDETEKARRRACRDIEQQLRWMHTVFGWAPMVFMDQVIWYGHLNTFVDSKGRRVYRAKRTRKCIQPIAKWSPTDGTVVTLSGLDGKETTICSPLDLYLTLLDMGTRRDMGTPPMRRYARETMQRLRETMQRLRGS
ncbi:hypothetical protein OKW30_001190 [Paraburkholderia sp. Clong3]|uniref:hypothetical protein n=1 Tax=Paraburkholderia sp. Clong3 TaxID=2991061 RepID=UPI003D252EB2